MKSVIILRVLQDTLTSFKNLLHHSFMDMDFDLNVDDEAMIIEDPALRFDPTRPPLHLAQNPISYNWMNPMIRKIK